MLYKTGSTWRKWDLHVHTPCSLIQEYGKDDQETWEKFISDLEALPREFGVIGINDYLFIDGYKKVLAAKKSGRLGNIDLILPVIELRLDKFGGSDSRLSRVNYHVIFSDELDPEVIEHQFLSALSGSYQLSPKYAANGIAWKGVPNRAGLIDLGEKIIASVPEEERSKFDSPIKEGFFNLNLSLSDIQKILAGPYFKGKTITAVGKTEWSDIKWNDQSIADKKMIINSADLVFTSATSPAACVAARAKLTSGGVNDRLLDCSDAHRLSTSQEKDRIGKCFTWIKSDPTFIGLRQAIHESSERIFVGDTPQQLITVREAPTKFIRSLALRKTDGSALNETWFDGVEIEFGTGLIAVIGNKGSGKSALVDILGLLSNSYQHANSSFLGKERFNPSKRPKGAHFEATLEWHSGVAEKKLLHEVPDPSAVSFAKYIPQHFFEKICNEIAIGESAAFDEEIKDVIFTHVPHDARLGQASLNQLVSFRTSEIGRALTALRETLNQMNGEILEMRAQASDEYYLLQTRHLEAKLAELKAHEENKPAEVPKPGESGNELARLGAERIEGANLSLADLDRKIADAVQRRTRVVHLIAISERVGQRLVGLRQQMLPLVSAVEEDFRLLGIDPIGVIQLIIGDEPLRLKEAELRREKKEKDDLLDGALPTSLIHAREALIGQIAAIQAELAEPDKQYQSYLNELRGWEEKRTQIIGTQELPGSIKFYEAILNRLGDLPIIIEERVSERLKLVKEIYGKIMEMKAVYEELYRPVQKFIDGHSIAKEQFRLNFDVEISETGFAGKFFALISQQVVGSFCGTKPGEEQLAGILERHDFSTEEGAVGFVQALEYSLTNDIRKTSPEPVVLDSQMKKGMSPEMLNNYVFGLEYLVPKYSLQMAGKNLDQLSPGEKGSLLLVFYLLVDRNDTPLLIDQPEENLDNQTIVSLLVPSIKEAKRRRQIFVVTHNPNIAVVCDAEQIICASHEPHDNNRMTYRCGSIEDPEINKRIMDILEGTKPAFDNRSVKYQ